ncbi:MAG: response regulator transcription factor [[Actinobacillus] rossii]|nr:response regulator transcription factor [[Actinobacillus] rossii]MDY3123171.1 response regulator transcription factor [[Actinobacillus] rossii]
MRILLVEDDRMIAEAVSANLRDSHYAVDWVNNGKTAEEALMNQSYDLVLLDLGLPGQDGLKVLAHIRQKKNNTPVLIVTARDDLESRLSGLDGGADDYIVKPFDMAELQARMRAVLRRHGGQSSPKLSNGTITLDPTTYLVEIAGQAAPIMLSNKEFSVLQALISRAGMILSRADLEDKIYAWGEEVESNAIDFLIYGLRKKIGKEQIKNVRGVGWMMPKGNANV